MIKTIPTYGLVKMQKLAQEKGISLNKLVVQCCEYALKNLE